VRPGIFATLERRENVCGAKRRRLTL
jgi:hypothetical protein